MNVFPDSGGYYSLREGSVGVLLRGLRPLFGFVIEPLQTLNRYLALRYTPLRNHLLPLAPGSAVALFSPSFHGEGFSMVRWPRSLEKGPEFWPVLSRPLLYFWGPDLLLLTTYPRSPALLSTNSMARLIVSCVRCVNAH